MATQTTGPATIKGRPSRTTPTRVMASAIGQTADRTTAIAPQPRAAEGSMQRIQFSASSQNASPPSQAPR